MVADVLAEGDISVGHQAGKDLHLVELVCQDSCLLTELGIILVGPPVDHVSVLVEHTALVVESMAHLMSYHDTDRTVVDCIVSIGIEERRLKDGCGEADLVGGGIVIGIDSLRSHSPLCLVSRLADLVHVVLYIELAGSLEVLVVAL